MGLYYIVGRWVDRYVALVEWYWQGKTEVLGENVCPSAALSTTNTEWTDLIKNPGFSGELPTIFKILSGLMKIKMIYVIIKNWSKFEKLYFALPREENKFVTLVMEDGEVAVRGVVTFEVASLHWIQKYRTIYDPLYL